VQKVDQGKPTERTILASGGRRRLYPRSCGLHVALCRLPRCPSFFRHRSVNCVGVRRKVRFHVLGRYQKTSRHPNAKPGTIGIVTPWQRGRRQQTNALSPPVRAERHPTVDYDRRVSTGSRKRLSAGFPEHPKKRSAAVRMLTGRAGNVFLVSCSRATPSSPGIIMSENF
jgi:hypothetical protein